MNTKNIKEIHQKQRIRHPQHRSLMKDYFIYARMCNPEKTRKQCKEYASKRFRSLALFKTGINQITGIPVFFT